ncbi:MAG: hypothetical protein WCK27_02895 [Verrucomicrobiota bacterium]
MLTEAEYVEQQRQLGKRLHEHDGVWWSAPYLFYAKPAFQFRSFPPGTAKPRLTKSLLGYTHLVPDRRYANSTAEFMILEGEDLRQFSMARLRKEKRNQVRKGLRLCEVRPITSLEPCIEEIRQINISQAKRLMKHDTFGLPDTYYIEHEQEWKAAMRRRFDVGVNEWWGAFHEGMLVAYMETCQVENLRFGVVMKAHSDHLKLCATDAIYFTVLMHASRDLMCDSINHGEPMHESVNWFKQQFLFKRTVVFRFVSNEALHTAAKRLLRCKEVLRAHFQRFRSPNF